MKMASAFLALVVLPIGVQTKPARVAADSDKPPTLSKQFMPSGQLALEAIKRLDEAREEPSSSYEPRLLDTEKAVSEATRKARTPEDKHVAEVLDTYLQGLRNERNPNLSHGRETPAGVDHWEHAIFPCAVEADWYFGTTLAKKGIEIAKQGSCAPNSKPKQP
jgi:hypothetical protein